MKIEVGQPGFAGEVPRVEPVLLPGNVPTVAEMAKLLTGDLEAWNENALADDPNAGGESNFGSKMPKARDPGESHWSEDTYVSGPTHAELIAQRESGSDGAVTVDYATSDLTALAGPHYEARSGTFSWAHADAADKQLNVPVSPSVPPEEELRPKLIYPWKFRSDEGFPNIDPRDDRNNHRYRAQRWSQLFSGGGSSGGPEGAGSWGFSTGPWYSTLDAALDWAQNELLDSQVTRQIVRTVVGYSSTNLGSGQIIYNNRVFPYSSIDVDLIGDVESLYLIFGLMVTADPVKYTTSIGSTPITMLRENVDGSIQESTWEIGHYMRLNAGHTRPHQWFGPGSPGDTINISVDYRMPLVFIQTQRLQKCPPNPCAPDEGEPPDSFTSDGKFCLWDDGRVERNMAYTDTPGNYMALSLPEIDSNFRYIREYLPPIIIRGGPNDNSTFWNAAYASAVADGLLPSGMTYESSGLGSITNYPRRVSSACARNYSKYFKATLSNPTKGFAVGEPDVCIVEIPPPP